MGKRRQLKRPKRPVPAKAPVKVGDIVRLKHHVGGDYVVWGSYRQKDVAVPAVNRFTNEPIDYIVTSVNRRRVRIAYLLSSGAPSQKHIYEIKPTTFWALEKVR